MLSVTKALLANIMFYGVLMLVKPNQLERREIPTSSKQISTSLKEQNINKKKQVSSTLTVQERNEDLLRAIGIITASNLTVNKNKNPMEKIRRYNDKILTQHAKQYKTYHARYKIPRTNNDPHDNKEAFSNLDPNGKIFVFLYRAIYRWRLENKKLQESGLNIASLELADQKKIKYAYQYDLCQSLQVALESGTELNINVIDVMKIISFLIEQQKSYFNEDIDTLIKKINASLTETGVFKGKNIFMLDLYMKARHGSRVTSFLSAADIIEHYMDDIATLLLNQTNREIEEFTIDDLALAFSFVLELAYSQERKISNITKERFLEKHSSEINKEFALLICYIGGELETIDKRSNKNDNYNSLLKGSPRRTEKEWKNKYNRLQATLKDKIVKAGDFTNQIASIFSIDKSVLNFFIGKINKIKKLLDQDNPNALEISHYTNDLLESYGKIKIKNKDAKNILDDIQTYLKAAPSIINEMKDLDCSLTEEDNLHVLKATDIEILKKAWIHEWENISARKNDPNNTKIFQEALETIKKNNEFSTNFNVDDITNLIDLSKKTAKIDNFHDFITYIDDFIYEKKKNNLCDTLIPYTHREKYLFAYAKNIEVLHILYNKKTDSYIYIANHQDIDNKETKKIQGKITIEKDIILKALPDHDSHSGSGRLDKASAGKQLCQQFKKEKDPIGVTSIKDEKEIAQEFALTKIRKKIADDMLINKKKHHHKDFYKANDILLEAKRKFSASNYETKNMTAACINQLTYSCHNLLKSKENTPLYNLAIDFLSSLGQASASPDNFKNMLKKHKKLLIESKKSQATTKAGAKIYKIMTSSNMIDQMEKIRIRFYQNSAHHYINDDSEFIREVDSLLALQTLFHYIHRLDKDEYKEERKIINNIMESCNGMDYEFSNWPFATFEPQISISTSFTKKYKQACKEISQLEKNKGENSPASSSEEAYGYTKFMKIANYLATHEKSPALLLKYAQKEKLIVPKGFLEHNIDESEYYFFTNISAIDCLDTRISEKGLINYMANGHARKYIKSFLPSIVSVMLEKHCENTYPIPGNNFINSNETRLNYKSQTIKSKKGKINIGRYLEKLNRFHTTYNAPLSGEDAIISSVSEKYKSNYVFNEKISQDIKAVMDNIKKFQTSAKGEKYAFSLRAILAFNRIKKAFELNREVAPLKDCLNKTLFNVHFPYLVNILDQIYDDSIKDFSEKLLASNDYRKKVHDLIVLDTLYTVLFEYSIDELNCHDIQYNDVDKEFYGMLAAYVSKCSYSDTWPERNPKIFFNMTLANEKKVVEIDSAEKCYSEFLNNAVSIFKIKYPNETDKAIQLSEKINTMPNTIMGLEKWLQNTHHDDYARSIQKYKDAPDSTIKSVAKSFICNSLALDNANDYNIIDSYNNNIALEKYDEKKHYFEINKDDKHSPLLKIKRVLPKKKVKNEIDVKNEKKDFQNTAAVKHSKIESNPIQESLEENSLIEESISNSMSSSSSSTSLWWLLGFVILYFIVRHYSYENNASTEKETHPSNKTKNPDSDDGLYNLNNNNNKPSGKHYNNNKNGPTMYHDDLNQHLETDKKGRTTPPSAPNC